MQHEIATHALEKGGLTGTQIGGVMALIGGVTLNDLLAIAGFGLALFSVLFQVWATWYFKSKHLAIAQARLAADLKEAEGDD
jgi:hypothetical protein